MKALFKYVWECCQINTGLFVKEDYFYSKANVKNDGFKKSLIDRWTYYTFNTSPWNYRNHFKLALICAKQYIQKLRSNYLKGFISEAEYEEGLLYIDNQLHIKKYFGFRYTNPFDAFLSIYAEVLQEEMTGVQVAEGDSVIQSFY